MATLPVTEIAEFYRTAAAAVQSDDRRPAARPGRHLCPPRVSGCSTPGAERESGGDIQATTVGRRLSIPQVIAPLFTRTILTVPTRVGGWRTIPRDLCAAFCGAVSSCQEVCGTRENQRQKTFEIFPKAPKQNLLAVQALPKAL